MKIYAKKIIYLHLYVDIYINIIKNVIPQLSFLAFVPDVLNMVLLLFFIKSGYKKIKNKAKELLLFVTILFLYDIILAMCSKPNLLLFIWGLRNQYRFLLFALFFVTFIDYSDLTKIKRILFTCFNINMIVVPIEFVLGYRRDYLGGTFGIEHNCNGVTNIFLVIIACYAIISFLYKEITFKKFVYLMGGSLFWVALAEIKIYFVELILIVLVSIFLVKGRGLKKIKLIIFGAFAMIASVYIFFVVFPDQMNYILEYGLAGYSKNVNVGIYGYGRTTAIPLTNKLLFNNELTKIVFGLGTGNAEFINIGSFRLNSEFYEMFGNYGYATMFYSFIYVERGLVGLFIYFILFIYSMYISIKGKKEVQNVIVNNMLITCIVVFILISIYDASFRVSTGGYFAFMIIAMPFVVNKININQGLL